MASSYRNETDSSTFEIPPEFRYVPERPSTTVKTSKIGINVVPFVERHHFNLDEFEYNRTGNNPGKILIFNQEFFDNPAKSPTRTGTQRDVNEIILCFQRLGFNICEDDIFHDSTVAEILDKLDLVLADTDELREANCLIVFFLTHGHPDNRLEAKDGLFDSKEIWTRFNHCKQLEHKPKMFVFQACKGNFYATLDGKETPLNLPVEPSKLLDIGTFSASQLGKDMLLVYSTIEGNVSFRDPASGTWFIQELCKNFLHYGRRDDVVSLITRINKCVSGNYFDLMEYGLEKVDHKKQMPIFVSTLSKKFYLNRNKDRHLLLEISRMQEEIYEMLKELTNRIRD